MGGGVYPDISAILEKQKMKDLVEAELVTLPEDSTAYGGVKAMRERLLSFLSYRICIK
jgi:hypothetical protein